MNEEIKLQDSAQVKELANSLIEDAQFYSTLVTQLQDAKSKLQANWEGDVADIQSIIVKIDVVVNGFNVLIPNINDLANALIEFAQAAENAGDNDMDNPELVIPPDGGDGSGTTTPPNNTGDPTKITDKAFWTTIADDFKDDWDFSSSDGLISGLGDALGGLVNFAGSAVNTVGRVVGGALSWIFD